jgi:hypothetical protein
MVKRLKKKFTAKESFLISLSQNANVSQAAKFSEVNRNTAYKWRQSDPDFAEAWDRALEDATDALEAEARRRATEGYEEPIIYGGKVIVDPETGRPIVKKKYSDALMVFLLKSHRPNRYRGKDEEGRPQIIITISPDDAEL